MGASGLHPSQWRYTCSRLLNAGQWKHTDSGGTTDVIKSELHSATNYTIEVSALNNAGIGVYSDPIQVLTESKSLLSLSHHNYCDI